MTLQLDGADPESSPITYSAKRLPTGLALNTNTGFISGTPTAVGTFNVQATVSDGNLSITQAFTWTIGAALPGAATLLRPTGSIATATPTFEWESVATATSYRLWVDDASTTDPKIQVDYTPAQAGCSTAGAVCQARARRRARTRTRFVVGSRVERLRRRPVERRDGLHRARRQGADCRDRRPDRQRHVVDDERDDRAHGHGQLTTRV